MIALYAITDHPTAPLPALGGLELVSHGNLAVVCGPASEGEVTAEILWEHERIVEALMADRDLVPARYGTRVRDDAAAAQALQEHHDAFSSSLDFVRGAVELSVRAFSAGGTAAASAPSPQVTATRPGSGTEYLRARAHEAVGEATVAKTVHEPLARAARAEAVSRGSLSGELLRAAYLVDRDQTHSFSARVQELQDSQPHLALTCTGPWPPYSFVAR